MPPSEVFAPAARKPSTVSSRKKRSPQEAQHRKAALHLVAERLRNARELNGLSLSEAASRLGFESPSSVSKLENVRHITEIPLWFLMEAARVYEVSGDYLLGLTDEIGLQPRIKLDREVSGWLHTAIERNRARDMQAITLLHEEIVCALTVERDLTISLQEIDRALDAFVELNPRFKTDMKGGARLLRAVEDGMSGAAKLAAMLSKFRGQLHASRSQTCMQSTLQMDLLAGAAPR